MVRTEHDCEDVLEAREATPRAPYHFTESGLPNVYLIGIQYYVCKKCKKKAAEIPALDELMKVIARTIVNSESQLTGEEIRFLRKRLRMKSADFAQVVGVTPEQVSRWENNSNSPEKSTDKFIRVYYSLKSNDELLRARLNTAESGELDNWLKTIPELEHIEIRAALNDKREWKAAAVGA